ncbi:hypothetical protein SEVIR_5G352666v4 [Setaria viridis]
MACAVRLSIRYKGKKFGPPFLPSARTFHPPRPQGEGKKHHQLHPLPSNRERVLSASGVSSGTELPRATRFLPPLGSLKLTIRYQRGAAWGKEACAGWTRTLRQLGGGGRRGPTCLYACSVRGRCRRRPGRGAPLPDPSSGRTDRDASSSSPRGARRARAATCSLASLRGVPLPRPLQAGPTGWRLCLCVRVCLLRARFAFGITEEFFVVALARPVFRSVSLCSSARRVSQLPAGKLAAPPIDLDIITHRKRTHGETTVSTIMCVH